MLNFIIENQLVFTTVDISMKNDQKMVSGIISGWQNKTHQELIANTRSSEYYMVRPSNKYVVFDADDIEAYEFLLQYLSKNDLLSLSAITKSVSNIKLNKKYKNHFWFQYDHKTNFQPFINQGTFQNAKRYDVLFSDSNIFEHEKSHPHEIPIIDVHQFIDLYNSLLIKFPNGSKHLCYNQLLNQIYTALISEPEEQISQPSTEAQPTADIKKIKRICKKTTDTELNFILSNLSNHRFIDYDNWIKLYFVFVNEDLDLEIFHEYSKKACEASNQTFNRLNNEKILKSHKKDKGLKLSSLYYWLKEDNETAFNELMNNSEQKKQDDKFANEQYLNWKQKFESTHFFLNYPCCIMKNINTNYIPHDETDIRKIEKPNTCTVYGEYVNPDKPKNIECFELWLQDKTRRTYEQVVFKPENNIDDNIFNLFDGFINDTQPDEIADLKIFHDYMNHLFSNNQTTINYVLDWISHIINYPQIKTDVLIVLYSEAFGVGKSTLPEVIKILLSSKYATQIQSYDHLFEKFNYHLNHKFFVYGDEIKARRNDNYDGIKNIITRKEYKIEQKGKDAIIIDDLTNYMVTTNHYNSMKCCEGERRLTMIECNEDKMDKSQSTELYTKLKDKSFIRSLFQFIKNRDVKPEPMQVLETDYRKNLQIHYMNTVDRYIFTKCRLLAGKRISKQELLQKIKSYEQIIHITEISTVNELTKKLSALLKDDVDINARSKDGNKAFKFPDNLYQILEAKNRSALEQYYENDEPHVFVD